MADHCLLCGLKTSPNVVNTPTPVVNMQGAVVNTTVDRRALYRERNSGSTPTDYMPEQPRKRGPRFEERVPPDYP
jgi:hypothetical protein